MDSFNSETQNDSCTPWIRLSQVIRFKAFWIITHLSPLWLHHHHGNQILSWACTYPISRASGAQLYAFAYATSTQSLQILFAAILPDFFCIKQRIWNSSFKFWIFEGYVIIVYNVGLRAWIQCLWSRVELSTWTFIFSPLWHFSLDLLQLVGRLRIRL